MGKLGKSERKIENKQKGPKNQVREGEREAVKKDPWRRDDAETCLISS